jgi:DNA-directed RNA polymerase specialized sigma24 family protein
LDEDLKEKYGIDLRNLLEIAKEEKELEIPVIIFRQKIRPAEALCKYLKENLGLRYSEIAKIINRNDRTVWINYRNAIGKMKEKIRTDRKMSVSINIFSDRRLSILESIVKYLKEKGYRNYEIAQLLGKDQRNIYTLYSRTKKKLI